MVVADSDTLYRGITVHDQSFFWENGYLPIGRVSAPSVANDLKVEAGRMLARKELPEDHVMRSPADGHVRVALHLCHRSELFRQHAFSDITIAEVTRVFGEEPMVLTSLMFNKPPCIGMPLALHQDLPYYPYLGADDLVTCWMALDQVDDTNGGVEYLPGSHRQRLPHRETGTQQALDIDPSTIDTADLVSVPLQTGEAVLHHGLTVHRSAANTSDRPRAGLATLYVRSSVVVSSMDFPYGVISTDKVHGHAHP